MDKSIKRPLKKVNNAFFSRMFIIGIATIVQIFILGSLIIRLSEYFVYAYLIFTVLSVVTVIYILNTTDNPSYKLAWIIPILLIPIFGVFVYLMFGYNSITAKYKKEIEKTINSTLHYTKQDTKITDKLTKIDPSVANQSKYISNYSGYALFENTTTKYLSPGEDFFERLKEELNKAQHFIFMEYFIVQEGVMWNEVLDIMVEKVKQGVEVRMMYDDVGTLRTLPSKYHEKLEQLGIKTVVFNEITLRLSKQINNRDHRKVTVIDGHTGFVGGINLADEYINAYEKFGHWKDSALYLQGDAVWNLTVMFLQSWQFNTKEEQDYEKYRPHKYHKEQFETDGYVQTYGDSPLDKETVGENVYLNIINRAKEYVYITTPYLVVDNEVVTALSLAAKSGVDVRIITPYKEDKWYVHLLTRANYAQLIQAGVKIYEYTPGFIHSKTFVADDEIGVVGTINLDYRSLYLHFECGVWMYKTKSIFEIKEDFMATLEISEIITLEKCNEPKVGTRLARSLMKVFAPMM